MLVHFNLIKILCLIQICYNSFMNKIEKLKINIEYVDNFLKDHMYLVKCLNGCSDCCYDYFYASLPEFFLTLYGITQMPYNIDFFYNRALKSRNYFEQFLPLELERLSYRAPTLLAYQVNDFSSGEYINYPKLPPCMFLVNGRCSIYDYRPNTCRKYGTTVTCEYIKNDDYQNDEFTNYHLYPLYENTKLLDTVEKTTAYPLWFYYSEFLKPELRTYVFSRLEQLQSEQFIYTK